MALRKAQLFIRHTALHAVGASVPECFRLARRFEAEARWANRASSLTIGTRC